MNSQTRDQIVQWRSNISIDHNELCFCVVIETVNKMTKDDMLKWVMGI